MPLSLDSMKGKPWIETYERVRGDSGGIPLFEWRLKGANGEIVCSTLQSFTSRSDAEDAAFRAVELMTTPNLEVRSV